MNFTPPPENPKSRFELHYTYGTKNHIRQGSDDRTYELARRALRRGAESDEEYEEFLLMMGLEEDE